MESGTTGVIDDVWGVTNPITNKEEVYFAEADFVNAADNKILKLTDHTKIDTLPWEGNRHVSSVWSNNGFPLYACGYGLLENSAGSWKEIDLRVSASYRSLRGTALNDIFVAGWE